jgi:hypothetical protein
MDFPVSQAHIDPIYLIVVGFVIGVLGGFFGVGGSFIAGPALRLAGLQWNMAVGTDLAHIMGKSVVAARKHRALGNIDFKLGFIMMAGTIVGAEAGAQGIEALKRHGDVNMVVSWVSIVVYFSISMFMAWDAWKTLRVRDSGAERGAPHEQEMRSDRTSVEQLTARIQKFHFPPMISLPTSGIEKISVWVIVAVAFVGGIFSGFLGGGAGYIRMPSMVFLLGIPTHLAIGTDLFEVVISAGYATASHAMKGNVDILIALVMNTGAAIGAQIGATATQFFRGPGIRMAFVPLPLIGMGIVIYTLITGQKL